MVFLRRVLMNAIEVDRPDGVRLIDGEVLRRSVDLPGTGIDDPDARSLPRAFLQEPKLRLGIERRVAFRPAHAVDVADLARQVEHHRGATDRAGKKGSIANIRANYGYIETRQIMRVGATSRDTRINYGYVGPCLCQTGGKIAADETESPRNQHPVALVCGIYPITCDSSIFYRILVARRKCE